MSFNTNNTLLLHVESYSEFYKLTQSVITRVGYNTDRHEYLYSLSNRDEMLGEIDLGVPLIHSGSEN